LKLEEALNKFNVSVKDKIAADLGASTGGFTDCLLQSGAKGIYAVDVEIRQMDWNLSKDSRVVCIDKNARHLSKDDFPEELDLVTMDLSFISVLKVLPALKELLGKGMLLCLIKPQFEVGRGQVGEKGVVRDGALHEEVLNRIINEAGKMGFGVKGLIRSSTRGQKGNREFFVLWSLGKSPFSLHEIQVIIKEAVWDEKY
jgi:23S rRNA (cytidine1920-2'-O)/16S rRNA (cytidine1409-2'-O)-methyltransferase